MYRGLRGKSKCSILKPDLMLPPARIKRPRRPILHQKNPGLARYPPNPNHTINSRWSCQKQFVILSVIQRMLQCGNTIPLR